MKRHKYFEIHFADSGRVHKAIDIHCNRNKEIAKIINNEIKESLQAAHKNDSSVAIIAPFKVWLKNMPVDDSEILVGTFQIYSEITGEFTSEDDFEIEIVICKSLSAAFGEPYYCEMKHVSAHGARISILGYGSKEKIWGQDAVKDCVSIIDDMNHYPLLLKPAKIMATPIRFDGANDECMISMSATYNQGFENNVEDDHAVIDFIDALNATYTMGCFGNTYAIAPLNEATSKMFAIAPVGPDCLPEGERSDYVSQKVMKKFIYNQLKRAIGMHNATYGSVVTLNDDKYRIDIKADIPEKSLNILNAITRAKLMSGIEGISSSIAIAVYEEGRSKVVVEKKQFTVKVEKI